MNRLAFTLLILCLLMDNIMAQTVMPLYADSIPNSKPSKDEEQREEQHGSIRISKISRPTLTVFLPPKEKATGAAVIICPGGGYWIVAAGHEGIDVAKAFNKLGIAAFVLKYRIPDERTMNDPSIGPLQDAQQSIKLVRENAQKWNIDPARVGIMGFSAGGHLAATTGTQFNRPLISNPSGTSLRPDFLLLIYPVISFSDTSTHIGSRDKLLGQNASAEQVKLYSPELQVTNSTPPSFLVHASYDDVVSPLNSIRFYEALIHHHIPAELHLYQYGGHGFGMVMQDKKDLWMERCYNWLSGSGWLNKK